MAKKVVFLVFLGLFFLLGIFSFRGDLGVLVWQYFRTDDLALFLSPHDLDLRRDVASYYFGGGTYDFSKAQEQYEHLYGIGDRDKEVLYQLGRIRFTDHDFAGSVSVLNESLLLYPEALRVHYVRGLSYLYSGQFQKAQEAFALFAKAYPDEWAGYNDLAWAHTKEGEYLEALDVAKGGLNKFPENMWLHNSAGVAEWNLGNLEVAEEHFVTAKRLVDEMSVAEWGKAYPGNDPSSHAHTLSTMKRVVEENLEGARFDMGG